MMKNARLNQEIDKPGLCPAAKLRSMLIA